MKVSFKPFVIIQLNCSVKSKTHQAHANVKNWPHYFLHTCTGSFQRQIGKLCQGTPGNCPIVKHQRSWRHESVSEEALFCVAELRRHSWMLPVCSGHRSESWQTKKNSKYWLKSQGCWVVIMVVFLQHAGHFYVKISYLPAKDGLASDSYPSNVVGCMQMWIQHYIVKDIWFKHHNLLTLEADLSSD